MDDRRNMFPHAVRGRPWYQARAFMFENVRACLRKGFENYYGYILNQLRFPDILRKGDEDWQLHNARLEQAVTSGKHEGAHYNVVYQLLNAATTVFPAA